MTIDAISSAGPSRSLERPQAAVDAVALQATGQAPAATLATANAVKAPPTLEQVSQAVSKLNQAPQAKSQGLEFSIDQDTQRTVVKVIDQATKEVLRQMPTQEALEIAKSLESSRGLLLKQTA